MNSRYTNLFRFFFVCVDLVALGLVHFVLILNFHRIPTNWESSYGLLFLFGNIAWLISAYSVALYVEDGQPNIYRFTTRTLKAFLIYNSCMFFFFFFFLFSFS